MGNFGAASGGLVQGERFLGLTGPWGRRVLKFDGPMGPRVVVSPLRGDEFYMPLRGKTKQPRLRRVEMHPFCRLRRHLPQRGRF